MNRPYQNEEGERMGDVASDAEEVQSSHDEPFPCRDIQSKLCSIFAKKLRRAFTVAFVDRANGFGHEDVEDLALLLYAFF